MELNEARELVEDVLDTLVEVGNGTTETDLHKAADTLFKVRDEFLNHLEA